MWIYDFYRSSDLPPDAFWEPLIDIERWPQVDPRIRSTHIDGPTKVEAIFYIRKRWGFRQKREVVTLHPRSRFAERRRMPLATMTTTYSLYRKTHGCELGFCVEVTGPLARFWGPLVARRHVVHQADFVSRLIEHVKENRLAMIPSPHFKPINRNGSEIVATEKVSD